MMNVKKIFTQCIYRLYCWYTAIREIFARHGRDRANIATKELKEFIYKHIPECKDRTIPTPRAWTGPELLKSIPSFNEGDKIIWNDVVMPKEHGARKNFGEGPFIVRRVEDYIVALNVNSMKLSNVTIPSHTHIVIESPKRSLIFAHPSYFQKLPKNESIEQ